MKQGVGLTDLIHRAQRGDAEAVDALFAATYQDLRRLARARLRAGGRDTFLNTTSLVHESYLRLAEAGQMQLQDRLLMLDDAATAEGVLKQALAEGESGLSADHRLMIQAKSMMSQVYRRQSKPREMRAVLEQLLPLLREQESQYARNLVAALLNLANLAHSEYRIDECESAVNEALRVVASRLGGRDVNKVMLLTLQSETHRYRGDPQRALDSAEAAVRTALEFHSGNPKHAIVLNARHQRALVLTAIDTEAAVQEINSVVSDTKETLGGPSRTLGLRLAATSEALVTAGRIREAMAQAEESVRIVSGYQSPDSQILANSRLARGRTLVAARRGAQALPDLTHALQVSERTLGSPNAFTAGIHRDRGLAFAYCGRFDDAASEFMAAGAVGRIAGDEPFDRVAHYRAIALRLQNKAEALAQSRQALNSVREGPQAPLARARLQIDSALAALETGLSEEAERSLTSALAVYTASRLLSFLLYCPSLSNNAKKGQNRTRSVNPITSRRSNNMTITIFKDKDCKGKSQTVTNDMADLKDQPADKPSSIRLTSDNEAVLLFKNDDWHGGALYIRGPMTVSDLGSGNEGGRYGFGNSVRSIRRTSFSVDLNVNIVTDSGDRMPGTWKDRAQAEASVRNIVSLANGFLADKRVLLKCEIARVRFRLDTKQFDLSNTESWAFPGEWKEKDEVDVIVVNRFSKEEVGGRTKLPCFGKTLVIAAMANMSSGPDEAMTDEDLANVFAHELGHYFGLTHNTADDKQNNIMFEDFSLGDPLSGRTIWVDQIRELQDRLANHHTRRGDRD